MCPRPFFKDLQSQGIPWFYITQLWTHVPLSHVFQVTLSAILALSLALMVDTAALGNHKVDAVPSNHQRVNPKVNVATSRSATSDVVPKVDAEPASKLSKVNY